MTRLLGIVLCAVAILMGFAVTAEANPRQVVRQRVVRQRVRVIRPRLVRRNIRVIRPQYVQRFSTYAPYSAAVEDCGCGAESGLETYEADPCGAALEIDSYGNGRRAFRGFRGFGGYGGYGHRSGLRSGRGLRLGFGLGY